MKKNMILLPSYLAMRAIAPYLFGEKIGGNRKVTAKSVSKGVKKAFVDVGRTTSAIVKNGGEVAEAFSPFSGLGILSNLFIGPKPQTPAGFWAKDIRNRQLYKTGLLPDTVSLPLIDHLPKQQEAVLRDQIRFQIQNTLPGDDKAVYKKDMTETNRNGMWDANDYNYYQRMKPFKSQEQWWYGGVPGFAGLFDAIIDPRQQVERTLGQYRYYTDENGDTWVVDTFDYDFPLRSKDLNPTKPYTFLRKWGYDYGSRGSVLTMPSTLLKETPYNQKYQIKINLGRIDHAIKGIGPCVIKYNNALFPGSGGEW